LRVGYLYFPFRFIVYMLRITNATTADGSTLCLKVHEKGHNPTTKIWGVISRSGAIALHTTSTIGGARLYMSYFQVDVAGSGTVNLAGVFTPGAQGATEPRILIDI